MQNNSEDTNKIYQELKELSESVSMMAQSFRQLQHPIEESRQQVPKATQQLEKVNQQTEEATHQMLDMVEELTTNSMEILQNLKMLRKALPATYFKNHSKVRDTFERIETIAAKSQENAFSIMNALQFQDITAQQIQHASHLLDDVETKLHSIRGFFDHGEDKEHTIIHKKRAFDPDAKYNTSSETQQDVDNLLSTIGTNVDKKN